MDRGGSATGSHGPAGARAVIAGTRLCWNPSSDWFRQVAGAHRRCRNRSKSAERGTRSFSMHRVDSECAQRGSTARAGFVVMEACGRLGWRQCSNRYRDPSSTTRRPTSRPTLKALRLRLSPSAHRLRSSQPFPIRLPAVVGRCYALRPHPRDCLGSIRRPTAPPVVPQPRSWASPSPCSPGTAFG